MTVIDDFLQPADPKMRAELERIRKIIKQMVPDADDTIAYGIPVVKVKGKYLIGFAPYKDHFSIFPGAEPIAVLKDKLKDYKTAKGTVQFTLANPPSDALIKEIVGICLARIKE